MNVRLAFSKMSGFALRANTRVFTHSATKSIPRFIASYTPRNVLFLISRRRWENLDISDKREEGGNFFNSPSLTSGEIIFFPGKRQNEESRLMSAERGDGNKEGKFLPARNLAMIDVKGLSLSLSLSLSVSRKF